MSKTDLRIVKSKKAIKEAFLSLIKEKGYVNVTITDIAHKALINRKTFYTHYETKENLYNEIVDELIKDITYPYTSRGINTLKGREQRQAITHLLLKIKENKDVFEILINDNTNQEFIYKLKKSFINELFFRSRIDLKEKDTLFTFDLLSEAYFAIFKTIIQWWVNTEGVSTDYVINMILEFFSKKPLELLGINFDN